MIYIYIYIYRCALHLFLNRERSQGVAHRVYNPAAPPTLIEKRGDQVCGARLLHGKAPQVKLQSALK